MILLYTSKLLIYLMYACAPIDHIDHIEYSQIRVHKDRQISYRAHETNALSPTSIYTAI